MSRTEDQQQADVVKALSDRDVGMDTEHVLWAILQCLHRIELRLEEIRLSNS